MPNRKQIEEAKKTNEALLEMSRLLGTGLDEETLSICVELIETGMNPEVLASLVKTLQQEAARLETNSTLNDSQILLT